MSPHAPIDTARTLVAGDKGLLAMDESHPTCNQQFARVGIPQTEEARRAYRDLMVTTPGRGECMSGTILYDETIRQQMNYGTPLVKVITDAGIIPGIKVDVLRPLQLFPLHRREVHRLASGLCTRRH